MNKALLLLATLLGVSACGDSSPSRSGQVNNDLGGSSPPPSSSPAPTASPTASATPQATVAPTSAPTASPVVSASPPPSPNPVPTPLPEFGDKGACLVPVSPTTQATVDTGPACLVCNVTNAEAVTSANPDDVAEVTVSLGVIPQGGFADLALTVALEAEQDPTLEPADSASPLPDKPGFLVSFPDPNLLTLGVAPVLTVDALKDGESVATDSYGFGFFDALAVGLIGLDINNAQVYLPTTAGQPYDSVRLSVTGGLATALLNLNVHAACIAGVGGSISGDF